MALWTRGGVSNNPAPSCFLDDFGHDRAQPQWRIPLFAHCKAETSILIHYADSKSGTIACVETLRPVVLRNKATSLARRNRLNHHGRVKSR